MVTGTNNTSATYASQLSGSITPKSAANLVMVEVSGNVHLAASLNGGNMTLFRGTTSGTKLASSQVNNVAAGGGIDVFSAVKFIDGPNTASSQAYAIGTAGDGTHGAAFGLQGDSGIFGTMILTEIMG